MKAARAVRLLMLAASKASRAVFLAHTRCLQGHERHAFGAQRLARAFLGPSGFALIGVRLRRAVHPVSGAHSHGCLAQAPGRLVLRPLPAGGSSPPFVLRVRVCLCVRVRVFVLGGAAPLRQRRAF